MTDQNNTKDASLAGNGYQYVAAFYMVIKAGAAATRHPDDKYLKDYPGRYGRQLEFSKREGGAYFTVLYQVSGSDGFAIQLINTPYSHGTRAMFGAMGVLAWDEVDGAERYTKFGWIFDQARSISRNSFRVARDGDSIQVAAPVREGFGNASATNMDCPGPILWKSRADEKELDIRMTKMGPYNVTLNIPSREEIISGDELRDVDFMVITFNNISLRACNLPGANFSDASIANVRFGLSQLQGCNFSISSTSFSPENDLDNVFFDKADLSNARFDGRPIRNCNFEKAVLTNTSFKNACVIDTSFKGADFTKTDFSGVNFGSILLDGTEKLGHTAETGTIFRSATIPFSMIGKDWKYLELSDTRFTGAMSPGVLDATGVKLIGTQLPGVDFTNANFTNADLSYANLTGAVLTGANFTGANLTGTILNKADLTGAHFTTPPLFGRTTDNRTRLHETTVHSSFLGADWSYLDLTRAHLLGKELLPQNLIANYVILDGVNLNSANLAGASLDHAQMKATQLPNAYLTGAKMNNGILIGTIFTNADMRQAEMENADITNADFSGAELWGSNARLTGATAVNVSFNHAFLGNMDFSNIKGKALQGCNFSDACLVNANFQNTNLGSFSGKVTSFANAYLQGANFKDAVLTEANLANASVATKEGDFLATLRSRKGPQTLVFDPTTIPDSTTSAKTLCPSGDEGPCSDQKWASQTQRPDSWSYKTFLKKEED